MGSVTPYGTAKGKRYRVRYRKPDHAQAEKRGLRTRKEAELYLASVEVSKARGEYIEASASRVTVGQLGIMWLTTLTHLKPSSRTPIDIAWRIYVAPRWGDVPVGSVVPSDVQAWVAALTEGTARTGHRKAPGPRSATVVLRAYGILASILDSAVKDRRLSTNPARGAALPRKPGNSKLIWPRVSRLIWPHPGLGVSRLPLVAASYPFCACRVVLSR